MNRCKLGLIALAVLGTCVTGASAQSNVSIYGMIDLGLRIDDPKISGSSTTALVSGHQSGSRLGVRGSEDLGGGLSAVYALENGFSADTGQAAQGGLLFGRQVYGGLRGRSFGTVAAGRVTIFSAGTGDFSMLGDIDPFSVSFGISSIGSTFSSVVLRVDNAVLWQSPNWGGWRAGVGYSTAISGAEAAGTGNNNRMMFSALNYRAGPLFVAVTLDSISPTAAQKRAVSAGGLGASDNQTHLMVGGTFDTQMVKLHAAYYREDSQFGNTATRIPTAAESPTTRTADATGWMVGATIPFGAFRFIGNYQKRDGKRIGTYNGDRSVWSLGSTYRLSERSNLYASYGNSTGKGSLATSNTYNTKQMAVGLRHRF